MRCIQKGKRKAMNKNKWPEKKGWWNGRGQTIPWLEPAGCQFYLIPCPEPAFTHNQRLPFRVYSLETCTSHCGSVPSLLYALRWFPVKGHPCWCSGLSLGWAEIVHLTPSCHWCGMFSGRSQLGLFWRQSCSGKNKLSTVHFISYCQNLLKLIHQKLVRVLFSFWGFF